MSRASSSVSIHSPDWAPVLMGSTRPIYTDTGPVTTDRRDAGEDTYPYRAGAGIPERAHEVERSARHDSSTSECRRFRHRKSPDADQYRPGGNEPNRRDGLGGHGESLRGWRGAYLVVMH